DLRQLLDAEILEVGDFERLARRRLRSRRRGWRRWRGRGNCGGRSCLGWWLGRCGCLLRRLVSGRTTGVVTVLMGWHSGDRLGVRGMLRDEFQQTPTALAKMVHGCGVRHTYETRGIKCFARRERHSRLVQYRLRKIRRRYESARRQDLAEVGKHVKS